MSHSTEGTVNLCKQRTVYGVVSQLQAKINEKVFTSAISIPSKFGAL